MWRDQANKREGCDLYYYFLFLTSTIQSAAKTNFHGITAQGNWRLLNMDKKHRRGDSVEVKVSLRNRDEPRRIKWSLMKLRIHMSLR